MNASDSDELADRSERTTRASLPPGAHDRIDTLTARVEALEGQKLAAVDEVTASENDAATIEAWKALALAAEGKLVETASAERARIAQWHRRWAAFHGLVSHPTQAAKKAIAFHEHFASALERNALEEP